MTMERLRYLSCVPAAVRWNDRYVGDHVIRQYRSLGLSALLRDLSLPPDVQEFPIVGGIGKLTLRADGMDVWEPSVQYTRQAPIPANTAVVSARKLACSVCEAFADRCTASGCGCAGEGKPEVWSSRCPLGKWPSIDCNS